MKTLFSSKLLALVLCLAMLLPMLPVTGFAEGSTELPPAQTASQPADNTASEPADDTPSEPADSTPTEPKPTEPKEEVILPFLPQRLDVQLSADSVKVGSTVVVTVTTGKDVAYIDVCGVKVDVFTESAGQRIWQIRVLADEVGQQTVPVTAYNTSGTASESVSASCLVTAEYASLWDWLRDVFFSLAQWLMGIWG